MLPINRWGPEKGEERNRGHKKGGKRRGGGKGWRRKKRDVGREEEA